jgi:hypothetical protein
MTNLTCIYINIYFDGTNELQLYEMLMKYNNFLKNIGSSEKYFWHHGSEPFS